MLQEDIILKKIFSRVTSVILIISVVFSCAVLPANAAKPNESEEITYGSYYEKVYYEGYTPLSTEKALATISRVSDAIECVLGIRIINDEKIKTTVTGSLSEVFDALKENSNGILDCRLITDSFPQTNGAAKKITKLFGLDSAEVSKFFRDKSNEYYRQNENVKAGITLFLSVYMHIYDEFLLFSEPSKKDPKVQDILLKITYEDGTSEILRPGIKYNTETGRLYSSNGKGVMNIGFELDAKTQTIYTVVDAWQRNFGFMLFYDIFSYVTQSLDYSTKRIKFTYDNKEWMFQLWKGRYYIAPGAEMGIYTRPIGSKGSFYHCASDDEMLVMSIELYHGDDLLVKREPELHWWMTGFRVTDKAYLPESMTVKGTIEMRDEEMADLFIASAKKNGMQASRDGVLVYYEWDNGLPFQIGDYFKK